MIENKIVTTNVLAPANSVQTVEQFDALLAKFRETNPVKHALKLASGEFQKFREKLVGYVAPVLPKPEVAQEVVVEDADSSKPRLGRPPKAPTESKE